MQKIAILGGGIGALTTAFELTNDPNWKDNYEITIYQLGWRLGGKGASGRNQAVSNRIEEHGLHIWMGFYENAFHMMRRAYDECRTNNLMPSSPFQHVEDAFTRVNYTPVMEQVDGKWKLWPITWPSTSSFPGDDAIFANRKAPPRPQDFVVMLMDRMVAELDEAAVKHPVLSDLYKPFAGELVDDIGQIPQLEPGSVPEKHTWLHRLAVQAHAMPDDPQQMAAADQDAFVKRLRRFLEGLQTPVRDVIKTDDTLRRFSIIADLVLSTIIGMYVDKVLTKGFMAIEQYEATEWLKRHGCVCLDSAITRGMYDSAFSYEDGSPQKQRMGAGSMLYGALRLMLTYTGSFMWHMAAGMGETIASPIYLALKYRGVKFEFFHKVTNLGLAADKSRIETVAIDVQAEIDPRFANGYEPLFTAPDGMPCWPAEPFWEQLVNGNEIQKATNHDLESWWNNAPIARQRTLRSGVDFHLIVLGISLGAFPYICQELSAAKPEWSNMVSQVKTVRTQGLQLWLNRTVEQVGWNGATPVLSAYREPFDTWSDLSYLIAHENWGPQYNVQQIAYFCNAMPDDPNQPPFQQNPEYPLTMHDQVSGNSRDYVRSWLSPFWPKSDDPANPGVFDWSLLVNCTGAKDAFDTQFFHANIDPTERYVLSLPGTASYRLASGDSRFANLFLAGDWTFTDLNVGCIESTVVSGRMASKAISGKPDYIYASFGDVAPIAKKAGA